MIRRPPRSTLDRSSAASDVYKRQIQRDEDAHAKEDGSRKILLRLTDFPSNVRDEVPAAVGEHRENHRGPERPSRLPDAFAFWQERRERVGVRVTQKEACADHAENSADLE